MTNQASIPAGRSLPAVTPLTTVVPKVDTRPYFCGFPFTTPIVPQQFISPAPTHPFIEQLATSDRSYIVAAPTGAGKSSLLRASLIRALVHGGNSTIMVADPKAEMWSGLERLPQVVHYLTESMGDKLDLDYEELEKLPVGTQDDHLEVLYWAWCIKQAWEELQRRIKLSTTARRAGKSPPKFHPWILVIDEHFGCQSKYDDISSKVKQAFQLLGVMGWLSDIVVKGRALGVRCVLISQSHLCGELGFSSAIRRSFGVMVLGRVDKDTGMGDLSMVISAMNDRYLIPSEEAREALRLLFHGLQKRGATKLGMPIALNVQGVNPRLGMLPNLVPVDEIEAAQPYLRLHPEAEPTPKKTSPTGDTSQDLAEQSHAIAAIIRIARDKREQHPIIKAAQVAQFSRSEEPTKHMPADGVRELFKAIARMGLGTTEGEGSGLGLKLNQAE